VIDKIFVLLKVLANLVTGISEERGTP